MLIRSKGGSGLFRRQCVACGYSGRFVDRENQTHCPRCACDFSVRPPKSYAEMEGLDQLERRSDRQTRLVLEGDRREWRLVERWLVFLFVMSVIGISTLALAIAALPLR
jgi:hypothetical protein